MAEEWGQIAVTAEVYLSAPTEGDIPAYVRYLNERQIYDNTFEIPYPYHEDHGQDFLRRVGERASAAGRLLHWAIRDRKEGLIGMIAFLSKQEPSTGVDEVGFWLGKPFWGQGLMTAVLRAFTQAAFERFGYQRLELRIFADNAASCRVAEKCGYEFVCVQPGYYRKDDRKIDAKLYAIERQGTTQSTKE